MDWDLDLPLDLDHDGISEVSGGVLDIDHDGIAESMNGFIDIDHDGITEGHLDSFLTAPITDSLSAITAAVKAFAFPNPF